VMSGDSGVRRAETRDLPSGAIDYRIDRLVYDTYGLTDKEITVIETGLQKG